MRLLRISGPALLAVGFFLSTACRSTPGTTRTSSGSKAQTKAGQPSPPAVDPARAELDLERRVQAHAAYAAGVVSQLRDDNDAALRYFAKAAEADPENEDLALEAARGHLKRKQFDQAVALLKRAAARPDCSATVLSFLGLTQVQLGQTDEAITTYREALRRMPGSLGAGEILARLLSEKQQVEPAFAVLQSLAGQPSEDPAYWIDLSDLFQQQGVRTPAKAPDAKREALAALERAWKLNPSDPRLISGVADRFYDAGRTTEAEGAYLKLRQIAPSELLPAARLAEIYLRAGKRKEAREQLESLQRESPTHPLPSYYLGVLSLDEQQLERAAEQLERSLLLAPEFEPAYVELAATQLSLGRAKEALATLEKRGKQFKATFRTEYIAGLAAARLNRMDDAARHFTDAEIRAKAEQPALLDYRFYFQVGAALERGGRVEEATRYLLRSLELKSDFPDALNHLGYMWADRGENLERAHEMIRKAVDQEPENEAFLDSLGWVLFKLGRPAEALPWLEKSAKLLEKPDPTIHDHLGDVLAALKRFAEAADHYRQSLGLEKSEAVQKKLDALPK